MLFLPRREIEFDIIPFIILTYAVLVWLAWWMLG